MKLRRLHVWPRTPKTALALQRKLAAQVRLEPIAGPRRLIAGVDAAFTRDGAHVIAGVVLWDAEANSVLERQAAWSACRFPYVPGLLSFRELPAVLAALRRLRQGPDVVLCDAQGIAHPRRIGLASHLGLWLDLPTVGCAKSRLCGRHGEPGPRRGDWAPLWETRAREPEPQPRTVADGRRDGGAGHGREPTPAALDGCPGESIACIGAVLRTRDRVRPLYVSPGHRSDLLSSIEVTLACLRGFRLPEPTRAAHRLVTALRSQR